MDLGKSAQRHFEMRNLLAPDIETPLFVWSQRARPPNRISPTGKRINVSVACATELLPSGVLFDKLDDLIDIRIRKVIGLQELQCGLVRIIWWASQFQQGGLKV